MAIVKDPPRKPPDPPVVPEIVVPGGRPDSRRERPDEFGAPGFGNRAVYQGERSLLVDQPAPVTVAASRGGPGLGKSFKKMGITREEAIFLRALSGSGTKIEAFRKAFPQNKTTEVNKYRRSRELYKRIVAKIGEDEVFEAMGIGKQKAMEKIRQLVDAKSMKAFIVPDTGEVVEAGPYEDNTTQMNATKLLTQIHKMVPDDKGGGGGTVVVNLVMYNAPGTPTWPGGGRA